jgi:hypothetical protein
VISRHAPPSKQKFGQWGDLGRLAVLDETVSAAVLSAFDVPLLVKNLTDSSSVFDA